ncbi:MAG: GDP-mannose mannosyl hydrolase [Bacteroidales bacterium]|nr:GDP-mannose mannosyl hydrolase [Bacteroidales bacterium]
MKQTPLVALDLIIENNEGDFLLGWRTKKPAQDQWFVPGGRIRKDERMAEAFQRIAKEELGLKVMMEDAEFLGVYEHLYEDNVFDDPDFGTHYIVLGYRIQINSELKHLPKQQHQKYQWFSKFELLNHPRVHENTKTYFLV